MRSCAGLEGGLFAMTRDMVPVVPTRDVKTRTVCEKSCGPDVKVIWRGHVSLSQKPVVQASNGALP